MLSLCKLEIVVGPWHDGAIVKLREIDIFDPIDDGPAVFLLSLPSIFCRLAVPVSVRDL